MAVSQLASYKGSWTVEHFCKDSDTDATKQTKTQEVFFFGQHLSYFHHISQEKKYCAIGVMSDSLPFFALKTST